MLGPFYNAHIRHHVRHYDIYILFFVSDIDVTDLGVEVDVLEKSAALAGHLDPLFG